MHSTRSRSLTRSALRWTGRLAVPCAAAAAAQAQHVTYSIDYRGPTISWPDSLKQTPITEADVLLAPGGAPRLGPFTQRPGILYAGGGPGGLGLARYPICVGHPPGMPCGIEVDALSYGQDGPAVPNGPPGQWWFSVDEHAVGLIVATPTPHILSEGAGPGGALEAAADIFNYAGPVPPGPLPPMVIPALALDAVDGNGFRSRSGCAMPGLSLIEWRPPVPIPPALIGDNVDAIDMDLPPLAVPTVYFSLDASFVDPLTGIPNTGSAAMHGFVGGDVLRVTPGLGAPVRYANAVQLGLDRAGLPNSDDLDALALLENGIAGFQPSTAPYDWLPGPTVPKDMLFFSVRRGSAVVGLPDSFFGMPIQPGDVLVPPVAGGVSPFPGIFIAAENFGLATMRVMPTPFGDELDALDVTLAPVFDCNGNGIEDAVEMLAGGGGVPVDLNKTGVLDPCDIWFGASYDINANLVPDECELCAVTTYCVAKVNTLGCTPLIGAFGTPSATNLKPFWVSAVDVVSSQNGVLFYGFLPAATPFMGGTKCVKNPVTRCMPLLNSGGVWPPATCSGVYSYDFNARIQGGIDPNLVPGVTVYAQYWYRDPGSSANVGLSDGIQFSICP